MEAEYNGLRTNVAYYHLELVDTFTLNHSPLIGTCHCTAAGAGDINHFIGGAEYSVSPPRRHSHFWRKQGAVKMFAECS